MKEELLSNVLSKIKNLRVGILGDFCLDIYWEILKDTKNVSVETLKVINQVSVQKCSLGGAGNLALNVKDLNAQIVLLFGIVGDDLYGRELVCLMNSKGMNSDGVFTQNNDWLTNVYIKPMIEIQEQNRFDLGSRNSPDEKIQDLILKQLESSLCDLDVVIINQQLEFGIHSESFRGKLSKLIEKSRIPFIVDSRNFPSDYDHSIRKMNEFELYSLFKPGLKPQEKIETENLKAAALSLYSKFKKLLIITRGDKSTFLVKENKIIEIPGIKVTGEIDTVGAGDSFLAGFASCFGATQNAENSTEMGHLMASITIKKLRETGTAKPEEIIKFNKEFLMICSAVEVKESKNIFICRELPKKFAFTHAIFDHDGTLSVIRRGWESVMSEFMFETITDNKKLNDDQKLKVKFKIKEFIEHTTGIRTLEQMDGLILMIQEMGLVSQNKILNRLQYKQLYLDALMKRVKKNIFDIQQKNSSTTEYLIKGSFSFLNALKSNLKEIYLASGTDENDVKNEATILGLQPFFNGGIYGARDELDYDIKSFVIEQISNKIGRENMKNTLVIGDGPVEIREGRKWGAFTIGVASNEDKLEGINQDKKMRLIKAGAHVIIGDYQEFDKILQLLNLNIGV
jgi:bifunctional ADP-heptose synthase (sugar kinase/adenylyltransferase)/phosphoglycolate phosphatase-like HAD superfamily hydrolase